VDDSVVENKELTGARLKRISTAFLFPVGNYRCGYRRWEGFIPGYFAEQKCAVKNTE
jgi:hypothetical protein